MRDNATTSLNIQASPLKEIEQFDKHMTKLMINLCYFCNVSHENCDECYLRLNKVSSTSPRLLKFGEMIDNSDVFRD